MSHQAYQYELEPIVRPLDFIAFIGTAARVYFSVRYFEPIPLIPADFGSIASGSSVTDSVPTDLDLDDKQLAQYRITVRDDVQVTVKQPSAKVKYVVKNRTSILTYNNTHEFPNLAEIFKYQDVRLTFTVKNNTQYTIPNTRLTISGFRYIIDQITSADNKSLEIARAQLGGVMTVLPVEGYSGEQKP